MNPVLIYLLSQMFFLNANINCKLFVLLFYFKNVEMCILKDALFLTYIDSGTHPASYPWVTGALSLGVKRPGREADHSLPPSAVVYKE
jgi:hypothetical protein